MTIETTKAFLFITAIALLLMLMFLDYKYPPKEHLFDTIKYSIHPELRPKEPIKETEERPVIICPECKGSGEKIQDVNKMMMEAKCAIWMNGHTAGGSSAGCKDCKIVNDKYEHCEKAKIALTKFVEEYEKSGPKMSKAVCPGCMGGGAFRSMKDGVWMTQEQYEADLKEKKK